MELLHFYFLALFGIICCLEGPDIRTVRVRQDEDVVLPCSSGKTHPEFFVWMKDFRQEVFVYIGGRHYNNDFPGHDPQLKGRVFHFEDEVQSGNASIVIRNTKVEDSGSYTCMFRDHHPLRQTVNLVVEPVSKDRTAETIPGLALRPHVAILDQAKSWALLHCEVQDAFPKPKLEWVDSDNNRVPAEEIVTQIGGTYNIILRARVTRTDHFRCVATQEEINHTTYTKIFIYITESSTGLIVAVAALSVLLLLLMVLYYRLKYSKGKYFQQLITMEEWTPQWSQEKTFSLPPEETPQQLTRRPANLQR
ncbi:butyrophilin-like protein 10 [Mugil cephalus]|uniref:butyrophilin-like protein 10 n=1 Tax=Mugil cephalus TaxID=48193 RepID=UPI001FB6A52F|nr:butyrophilin-like protein 10 [Mugil cephalus]